jgi:pimeloyl-ACP methyl ester carboxylesterase
MGGPIRTTRIERDGFVFLEHTFAVPLDHRASAGAASAPATATIDVFAREIVAASAEHEERPYLLWFQGGPGNLADRPGVPGGWLARALEEFRVVLIDQRGTGRSTAITHRTLPGDTAAKQSDYLSLFRADSIVRDAEHLRSLLLGTGKWTVLGQSFGGFCALTYLSLAGHGLDAALITGGLPEIGGDVRDIYRATYAQTKQRNGEFFETYPEDRDRVSALVDHLRGTDEYLLTGEKLTVERLLTLGILLGTKNGFDQLHYLVEIALTTGEKPALSQAFLVDAGAVFSFAKNPLYAVLHESIYAEGHSTDWAADTVRAELPGFALDGSSTSEELLLSAEMIYPWQFDQDPSLVPLKDAAQHLARRTDWPSLYDLDVLAHNEVPAAAVVYTQDMFVPYEGSIRTAAKVRNLTTIIDTEHQHDGIRQDGAALLDQLLRAVRA